MQAALNTLGAPPLSSPAGMLPPPCWRRLRHAARHTFVARPRAGWTCDNLHADTVLLTAGLLGTPTEGTAVGCQLSLTMGSGQTSRAPAGGSSAAAQRLRRLAPAHPLNCCCRTRSATVGPAAPPHCTRTSRALHTHFTRTLHAPPLAPHSSPQPQFVRLHHRQSSPRRRLVMCAPLCFPAAGRACRRAELGNQPKFERLSSRIRGVDYAAMLCMMSLERAVARARSRARAPSAALKQTHRGGSQRPA